MKLIQKSKVEGLNCKEKEYEWKIYFLYEFWRKGFFLLRYEQNFFRRKLKLLKFKFLFWKEE